MNIFGKNPNNKNIVEMAEIYEVFDKSESISVYNAGEKQNFTAGSNSYNEILSSWNDMIDGAHDMPAFGVSINSYTLKEMEKGIWLEFEYDNALEVNGMPFEKLLVNVVSSFCGFNIIRYNADFGYEGRCFYLDLNGKNMSELYDLLNKI